MYTCKTCGKDITDIYWLTKKNYCSLQCEKNYKVSGDDTVEHLKSMFGIK